MALEDLHPVALGPVYADPPCGAVTENNSG